MLAYDAYYAIKNCIAFNVPGNPKKTKVNQHLTEFKYSDGSILRIYPNKSRANVVDENGFVIVIGALRINK